ncbi:glycosyltransferase family 2 protein [Erythrobacter rubeus]|uniref:glycosyltransferase family 2 protein n=1 Tax=Erythrobacter rubeus TaxID=2760803 RepID=UPI002E29A994|nr:glycosyltransferase family 2 protein [Erythrobacter rubeus]
MTIVALVEDGDGKAGTLASLEREGIAAEIVSGRPQTDLIDRLARRNAWVLPMVSGDLLASGAGALYRQAASTVTDNTHLVYADDDLIDDKGCRTDPHLKPDWNSELHRYFDFLTGAAIVRLRDNSADAFRSQDWAADLIADAVNKSGDGEIVHLHGILHHRRSRPLPETVPPIALSEQGSAALSPISVIVPTRNGLKFLCKCLDGLAGTHYPGPIEIIVIDNGSDDPEALQYLADIKPDFAKVLRDDGPFNFAALNNRAVAQVTGDMLCFLNNDIEVVDPEWLTILAHQARRTDVGSVGARLLYPDGRIQHAGVAMGIGGGAAHAHRLLKPGEPGYFHRHSLPQFVSAVTAACLVVEKEKFLAVGGFDADHFAVSFNDVDLCLKLNARGWRSLYEPRATLVHHESVSRGQDRDPAGAARLAQELDELQKRWGQFSPYTAQSEDGRAVDPFHHPMLSAYSEQFVLRL